MKSLVSSLPHWARPALRSLRQAAAAFVYRGSGRYCPVCGGSSRRFLDFGQPPRADARCPRCGALERHRFLWLYLSKRTNLFGGTTRRMLHVAPEPCLERRLRRRVGAGYLTADLTEAAVTVRMDVTRIPCRDASFDAIYCSHVLEHIADDRKAMIEFRRVLKNDGWALLLVPITAQRTYEDSSIVTAEDRQRVFGQDDHVRRYGPDYADRLREAGFRVTITRVPELASDEEAARMALTPASGEIFHCTR